MQQQIWAQESESDSASQHDLLQTTSLWGQDTLWNRVGSIAPCYPALTDPWKRFSAKAGVQTAWLPPESVKGQDKEAALGRTWKVGGPTCSPSCTKRHSDKRRWTKASQWLASNGKVFAKYRFALVLIRFGSNLLCLVKVKAKNAIRISYRWNPAMFCKMKSISLTWNHMPQPVHCLKRSCNRNFYQNNIQNHNQHQFPSLICAGWIHTE